MHPLFRYAVALTLLGVACDPTQPVADRLTADREGGLGHAAALAFAPDANPFGVSMVEWSERWWRWELSVPTEHNPSLDQTGADCARGQHSPVWFLGSIFGTGAVTRSCTVPDDRPLLITLSSLLNDYPCPDPNFQPAPGQSLEDFLTQGARAVEDGVNSLTLAVDGRNVANLFDYRFTSPLFYFTGDPSLTTAIDPCITGSRQPAVSDGFFIMLRPLRSGAHTVVFTAADLQGVHTSVTYNLTVRRGEEDDDR